MVSHASVALDGTLYFHAGEPDYSQLDLYFARPAGQGFGDAVKLPVAVNREAQQCTPFIDPEQRFLIYESSTGLSISFRDSRGEWSQAAPLDEESPNHGRGNPHISPDGRFLLFAAGEDPGSGPDVGWFLYWVRVEPLLSRARARAASDL